MATKVGGKDGKKPPSVATNLIGEPPGDGRTPGSGGAGSNMPHTDELQRVAVPV